MAIPAYAPSTQIVVPVNRWPWIETAPIGEFVGQITPVANTLYVFRCPRDSASRTIVAIEYCTGSGSTVAANVDAGVFLLNGTILELQSSSGLIAAVGASTWQSLPLKSPVVISPGRDIYLGWGCDGTTTRINGTGSGTAVSNRGLMSLSKASLLPIAANVTIDTATMTNAGNQFILRGV